MIPVINDVERYDIFRDMRRSKEQFPKVVRCAAKTIGKDFMFVSELSEWRAQCDTIE